MTHGDFRADNLFFEADGSVAAVDFQLVGTGRGAYDLAYFVTQSITSDDASRHERALFDRWIAALGGGRGARGRPRRRPGTTTARAALFCLVYPVVAWRGMDAGDPRQLDLATTMLERFDRAVAELDLADAALTPGGSDGRWPTLATRNPRTSADASDPAADTVNNPHNLLGQ